MSTAIRFDHVSKRFTLHQERPRSFQELVIQLFKRNDKALEQSCKSVDAADRQRGEAFWALRNVSFTVEHGETVGIIGPNGAGKSTVLKLISRIIEPTSGEIEVNGRIGALLELGAGFHPDLSGRENIYLNGSILGLNRDEINCKLDEIIRFAELERFIDMPVKHYSSGMRMRLGFSVAAQIDPEILLIDEVLAVGDTSFQYKCLERIDLLRRAGVTIIFVSHAVDQVARLCERALWLDRGTMRSSGPAERVIEDYLSSSEAPAQRTKAEQGAGHKVRKTLDSPPQHVEGKEVEAGTGTERQRWGDKRVLIRDVRLLEADGAGRMVDAFHPGQSLQVEIDYVVQSSLTRFPVFGLAIYRADGVQCYGTNTELDAVRFPQPSLPSAGTVTVELRDLQLLQGSYRLDVAVHQAGGDPMHDYIKNCLSFDVLDQKGDQGVFRPDLRWSLCVEGGEDPGESV